MEVNIISVNIQKYVDGGNNKDMLYLTCPKSYDFKSLQKILYSNIPKIFDEEKNQYVIDIKKYLSYLSINGIYPIKPLITMEIEIPYEWNKELMDKTTNNDTD